MGNEDVFDMIVRHRLFICYGVFPSGAKYVAVRKVWNSNDSMYYDDGEPIGDDLAGAIRKAVIRAVEAITKAKGE